MSSPPIGRWCGAFAVAILATVLVSPAVLAASTGFSRNFVGMKLQDQEGRPLDFARWRGRIVLINFVYTGCSTSCPVQTRALADMQRQLPVSLRSRVQLLSVSLDPLQDTPATLKDFAKRMGADLSNWSFATGRPQDVERLSQALRLFRPGAEVRKPDDHSTALWLVDPKGELRMRYAGNTPDVPRLLREIAALDALMNAPKL
jgi:protein SCO1